MFPKPLSQEEADRLRAAASVKATICFPSGTMMEAWADEVEAEDNYAARLIGVVVAVPDPIDSSGTIRLYFRHEWFCVTGGMVLWFPIPKEVA